MIELKEVCKVYKSKSGESFKALDNFSYSFLNRGLVGIYGDSGCGKTTLLNLIGGIDTLTSGDILIDNKSLTKFKNKELDAYRNQEIGFIFQDDNLIDNLNVFENVSLALSLRKINSKKRKELVSESLKEVGILDKEKKYPSELSGGEKQRVTIARALIKKPRIILADEPTGSLDKENSFEIMKILKELSKKYLVIVVSHDENLLNEFSDEIIKIAKGKIVGTRTINKINDEKDLKKKENKLTSLKVYDGFKLSLKNISYKKFKTFIVSLTLSLSIASLGLVLGIQNGVTSYIETLESETLSRYPVSIEPTGLITNDIFELAENEGSFTDEEKVISSINSNSFLRTNNLSNEFIEYLNNIDEEYKDAIVINDSTPMNVLYFDTLSEKVEHFTSSNNSFLNDFSNNTSIIWRALPQDDEDILNDYDVLMRSADIGLIFLDRRFTIPNYPSRLLSYLENHIPIMMAIDTHTDVGTIAEINGYGLWAESGDLIRFDSKLNTLLTDSALRTEMGNRGYQFLKNNYTVNHTASIIMSHFKKHV